MRKSPAESQKRISAIAEKGLGRSLTSKESEAIAALEKRVVVHEVAEWDEKAVIQFLRSITDDQLVVKLLASLANRGTSLSADLHAIAVFFGQEVATVIKHLDVDAITRKLSTWLMPVVRREVLPSNVQVLRFGLFESEGGFKMYVSSSRARRRTDTRQESQSEWPKRDQFAPVEEISALWPQLRKAGAEPWVVTQALIIAILKALLSQCSQQLGRQFALAKTEVLTGFDEGDDYKVRVNSGR